MNFTLITCTGDRPEAFALCEKWMARQTVKPVQWIVLCDGEEPTTCTMGQELIYNPAWRGPNSLNLKLTHALFRRAPKGEAIAFIEDDDWYAPEFLEWHEAMLNAYPEKGVVGVGDAIYYNVKYRWWFHNGNRLHASLCQTVIRASHLPQIMGFLNRGDPFIDMRIWRDGGATRPECLVYVPDTWERRLTIGIKGMPGRMGYGIGHHQRRDNSVDDRDMRTLRAFIGDDALSYEKHHQP